MSLLYDFAGNRSQVTNNGTATTWIVNNLNEYTGVGTNGVGSDVKGNIQTYNGWSYTYDAQNRLRVAQGPGTTLEFWYDGKNRQITRRINGDNSKITRSVWDGWNLLEERNANDAPLEYYLYGARTDELVLRWGGIQGDNWYGYDGRGNVSHLFGYSYSGLVIEHYTYDLAGKPTISTPTGDSLVDNRFMFQGRDYLKEGAIYDYRNRFYHPGLGRVLQPDPIGFKGDAGNLYRYCGNDPVDRSDPMGLFEQPSSLFLGYAPDQGLQGPGRDLAQRLAVSNMKELLDKFLSLFKPSLKPAPIPYNRDSESKHLTADNSAKQNQPGKPDYAIRGIDRSYPEKNGNTYWARIFWRIQLFHHNQKPVGPGIQFREEISFSEGDGFMQKGYWKGEQPTRDDGSVDDPWGLAFNRSDGHVKVTQTILAGGRQATWEAVVHADSTYDAQQYIPFH